MDKDIEDLRSYIAYRVREGFESVHDIVENGTSYAYEAHGRDDMLLPFSVAESLRDRLRAAGATVDWHQFVGGHEIPPIVLDAVAKFLRALS